MSKQHVTAFREQMAADPALAEQLREVTARPVAAGGGSVALIGLARARGLELTQAELDEVVAEGGLSELELDLVAGGAQPGGGAQLRSGLTRPSPSRRAGLRAHAGRGRRRHGRALSELALDLMVVARLPLAAGRLRDRCRSST
ncbi:MAG: Nif11-like leader peptide family natural product precursor [Planctomycetota bacterium]|nr:Nif11-like leader peptide family natural product precursor [Planctomycetota bacterium]